MIISSPSLLPSRRKLKDSSQKFIFFQLVALCILTFFNWRHSPDTSSSSISAYNYPHDAAIVMSTLESSCNSTTTIKRHDDTDDNKHALTDFQVPEKSFGACLIVMDDNHFLIEWLAYHYHRLPLRRLIIAIDPRSRTSPSGILKRYNGLMKITEWHEEDYMPPNLLAKHLTIPETDLEALEDLYLERQFQFYTRCMAILKKEKITWTAITDTDEYILPNQNAESIYNRVKNISSDKTIFEMIQETRKENRMMKLGCISMHRIQFGTKESPPMQVQNYTPPGYNGSDFVTLRWRYHDMDNKPLNGKLAKCMVNLTRALAGDFNPNEVNTHRPIKRLCSEENLRIQNSESPFVVYHYAGSWEQWSYRQDFRSKRTRETFDKFRALDKYVDDTIRPWLKDFVETYGDELAGRLLDGVGRLPGKQ